MNSAPLPRLAERLSQTLATLHAMGAADRHVFREILRLALAARSDLFCVWTVWEPDALDGADERFRGAEGHDATGRFALSWHREDTALALHPIEGYDRPGHSDWYEIPRKTGEVCIMEPGVVRVGGRDVRVTREIAPILVAGRTLGVLGTDQFAPPDSAPVLPLRRTPLLVRPVNSDGVAAGLQRLTRREREVHYWLCQGKSNDDISRILDVSPHTIKNHIDHIFQKLGVENRYAAALLHPSRAVT